MRAVRRTVLLQLLIACGGAGDSKPQPAPTEPAAEGQAAQANEAAQADEAAQAHEAAQPAAPADGERPPRPDEMPVQEDFEQRAESAITEETYELELDAIAAELALDEVEEKAKRFGVRD